MNKFNIDTLPIFYFKNTLVYLDDKQLACDAFHSLMDKHFNVLSFTKVSDFLEYINNYQSLIANINFLRAFKESEYNDAPTSALIEFNLTKITDIFNQKNKLAEISVAVIDYLMPEKNGIEVCAELKNYKFKKLILTGYKEYQVGI